MALGFIDSSNQIKVKTVNLSVQINNQDDFIIPTDATQDNILSLSVNGVQIAPSNFLVGNGSIKLYGWSYPVEMTNQLILSYLTFE